MNGNFNPQSNYPNYSNNVQNMNNTYNNQQSSQNYNYQNQNQQLRPQNAPNSNSRVVAHPSALQKAGMNVQRIKQIHKNLADDVIKTVESATQQERDALKKAVENLRNKEKQVMESSAVKQKVEKMETIGDQLENQMSQIKIAYNRAVRELKKTCTTQDEFFKKLKELDEKMEEALLNDEEKKMMRAIKSQLQGTFGGSLGGGNVRMIMM